MLFLHRDTERAKGCGAAQWLHSGHETSGKTSLRVAAVRRRRRLVGCGGVSARTPNCGLCASVVPFLQSHSGCLSQSPLFDGIHEQAQPTSMGRRRRIRDDGGLRFASSALRMVTNFSRKSTPAACFVGRRDTSAPWEKSILRQALRQPQAPSWTDPSRPRSPRRKARTFFPSTA